MKEEGQERNERMMFLNVYLCEVNTSTFCNALGGKEAFSVEGVCLLTNNYLFSYSSCNFCFVYSNDNSND